MIVCDLTDDDPELSLGLQARLQHKKNKAAATSPSKATSRSGKENRAAQDLSEADIDAYLAKRAAELSQASKPSGASQPASKPTAGRNPAADGLPPAPRGRASASSRHKPTQQHSDEDDDDYNLDTEARPKKRPRKAPSGGSQAEKQAQREAAKAAKQAQRDAEKLQKELAKAAKAAERQAKKDADKAAKDAKRDANQRSALINKILKGEHWMCQMQVVLCPSYQNTIFNTTLTSYLSARNTEVKEPGVQLDVVTSPCPLPMASEGIISIMFRMRDLHGTHDRVKQLKAMRASQTQEDPLQALQEPAGSSLEEVPFVLLVFWEPAEFAQHLQRDGCAGLLRSATRAHPSCSLGLWVRDFSRWCTAEEQRNGRQGRMDFSASALRHKVARLVLTCPAVQYKEMDSGTFGERFTSLVRTLGQHPYKDQEGFLDAVSGSRKARAEFEGQPKAYDSSARALERIDRVSSKEALVLMQEFGSLGGLMAHLRNPLLSAGQVRQRVADLKAGAKKFGPVRTGRLMHVLLATNPDEVVDEPDERQG